MKKNICFVAVVFAFLEICGFDPSQVQAQGQDGDHTINPMSFTKLDAGGNPLPDEAASWVMVRDNVTGLMWEVKQDKDGMQNYDNPNDADNTYTWYDPEDPYPGTSGDGTDIEDFIDDLNNAWFGGSSDWRLPTIKELDSIVDLSIPYPGPCINTTYFPNTQADWYWSSNTLTSYIKYAWGVYFYGGNTYYGNKYSRCYVRAVRDGQ
jgi:hypothetical protein